MLLRRHKNKVKTVETKPVVKTEPKTESKKEVKKK